MLLIDCYNVLHTTMPPMLAGLDEGRLCEALSRTTWARRGAVVVVADGKPKPLRAECSPVDSVELIFSGHSRTADSIIIDRLNAHTAPKRITVVSTDREIRSAARRRRCTVWTSEQFITRLVEQLRKGGPASQWGVGHKPAGTLSPEETAAWMAELDLDPDAGPPAPARQARPGEAAGKETPRDAPQRRPPVAPPDKTPDNPPEDHDDPFNIPGVWPPW